MKKGRNREKHAFEAAPCYAPSFFSQSEAFSFHFTQKIKLDPGLNPRTSFSLYGRNIDWQVFCSNDQNYKSSDKAEKQW